MSTVTSAQTEERAGPRQWTALAVLALPSLLLSLDLSVLFLALPHLSADLNPSSSQLLWIGDIYGFLVAGFLITMGGLGDRIGRRRLLLLGATAFAVASVLAAYATSAELLIAARALMGVAGATIQPCTLGLISNMFRNAKQRTVAISIWMSCFMVGLALGPFVGGVMLEFFWWGSVFLLAVPVMVLLLVTAPVLLPEYRDVKPGRVDLVSVLLSLGTILPVIYGLKQVVEDGLTWPTALFIGTGLVIGVVFVRRQRGLEDPLFDLRLLANRGVSGALGVLLFSGVAISGILLFFTQYLQLVEGLTPFRAGLLIIPYTVGVIVGSLASPGIAQRIRPGTVVAGGLALGTLGFLLVGQVQNVSGLTLIEIGLVIACGGLAPIYVLGTDLVVGSAPPEQAGSAGSLAMTGGEVGTALGIAVLGSVGTAVYRNQIGDTMPEEVPPGAADSARDTLAGAVAAAEQLPEAVGTNLLDAARDAFTQAFVSVAFVDAAMVALLAVIAAAVLRHIPPTGSTPPATPPTEPTATEEERSQPTPMAAEATGD
ncbi:MFS transporter [Salinispora pacifica]|uniref:MFS transporter n=1 Tax=Salinispora pacifica TaxID=351187 RepID=UPI000410CE40|nr:MFS transporter [Salinispora pacifica]